MAADDCSPDIAPGLISPRGAAKTPLFIIIIAAFFGSDGGTVRLGCSEVPDFPVGALRKR